MSPLLWQVCRLWIYLRRGRAPPALPDPIWYFAFGSNMNERLFRDRRHMAPLESRVARLDGYRLRFVVAGGRRPGRSAPADIVAAAGEYVRGVLYLLPLRKLARLDASEGRQYAYLWIDAEDRDGRSVRALTYRVSYPVVEGRPSRAYFSVIRKAAEERGLPSDYRAFLDRVETRD